MKKKPTTVELMSELAAELGYTVKKIDTNETGPVLAISNTKKFCLVDGGLYGYYPTNLRWQSALFKDKITTQKILKKNKINTISSKFFRIHEFQDQSALTVKIDKINWKLPLLVKPASGLGGQDISIIETKKDLLRAAKVFYKTQTDFLIQRILNYPEYRILIVHDKVMVIHSKNHKFIRSDGKRSIKEQLKRIPDHKKSKVFIQTYLKQQGWTLETVPDHKEKICYHLAKDNTREFIMTKMIPKPIRQWAHKLSATTNINVAGVDIFTPNGIEDPNSYIVIELNANPTLKDYAITYRDRDLSKAIFKRVLEYYFKTYN